MVSVDGGANILVQSLSEYDMDDKKRMYALEELVASLEESNSLLEDAKCKAERSEQEKLMFLARMSHEVRSPMNAILGFSQLMKDDEVDTVSPKHSEFLNIILKAGDHLLDVINEVLELVVIDSGKVHIELESVDVNLIIKDCLDLLQPLADQKNIKLIFKEENINYVVKGDFIRLKQVMLNIISNAIKYNIDGGRVVVSCDLLKNSHLKFKIKDEGKGIAERDYHKIFTPFERLQQHAGIKGSGMGLAIARQLIELMGGKIGVQSELGKGSTFWIELSQGKFFPQASGNVTEEKYTCCRD